MNSKKFLSRYGFVLLVAAIVVFRFLYSLSQEFWYLDEDVLQIYLIGLKSFTTHTYPYFGADLVYNGSQIPGALQGYLVSIGWFIWKIPEAPFIVLNILLTLGLGFLAWYASKRFPSLSRIFIWIYIFLIPWSICYFTRIVNPSYVIPGAIMFFVGIFEIYPQTRKNIIPEWLCFYFIGFAIFWIMQLHMSWVLLGPFTAFAFYYLLRTKDIKRIAGRTLSFIAGCITTASLLLPTLATYGIASGRGKSVSAMAEFHPEHFAAFFKLLGVYLGYACFDQNRFRSLGEADSAAFAAAYPWAVPCIVILLVTGFIQALWLLLCFFRKSNGDSKRRGITNIAISGFLLFFISTLFSMIIPPSHAAVLFFPLMIIYALEAYQEPMKKKWVRIWMYSAFGAAVIFYTANGLYRYYNVSMYKNRDAVVKALEQDNYKLVGLRRYEKGM
ncbi:MAG: hypothetical protein Q8896_00740 [Bacteroidota bacterium]|nr:hypothetical protein [Bacteroidota bacterium]